jgi:hypothetical protein
MTPLDSSVGLARQEVLVVKPFNGQQVSGWITSTQTDIDTVIYYGPFATSDEAVEWTKNLINAIVFPIHYPSFNAG